VEALSETAKAEAAAVVCVLHQPRSAIFQRLDDLLLLAAGGRVAYCGTAASALEHFESLAGTDKRCPPTPSANLYTLVYLELSVIL
jgi:ABC-type multidrug transport system ATPase subunit